MDENYNIKKKKYRKRISRIPTQKYFGISGIVNHIPNNYRINGIHGLTGEEYTKKIEDGTYDSGEEYYKEENRKLAMDREEYETYIKHQNGYEYREEYIEDGIYKYKYCNCEICLKYYERYGYD